MGNIKCEDKNEIRFFMGKPGSWMAVEQYYKLWRRPGPEPRTRWQAKTASICSCKIKIVWDCKVQEVSACAGVGLLAVSPPHARPFPRGCVPGPLARCLFKTHQEGKKRRHWDLSSSPSRLSVVSFGWHWLSHGPSSPRCAGDTNHPLVPPALKHDWLLIPAHQRLPPCSTCLSHPWPVKVSQPLN